MSKIEQRRGAEYDRVATDAIADLRHPEIKRPQCVTRVEAVLLMARADVKARMIELAAPAQAAIEAELSINLEKTERRLAAIIFADIDLATAKVPDVIAAVRQLAAMRGGNAPNRTEIGGPNGSPIEVTSDADRARLMAFMARHHAVASDSHEN